MYMHFGVTHREVAHQIGGVQGETADPRRDIIVQSKMRLVRAGVRNEEAKNISSVDRNANIRRQHNHAIGAVREPEHGMSAGPVQRERGGAVHCWRRPHLKTNVAPGAVIATAGHEGPERANDSLAREAVAGHKHLSPARKAGQSLAAAVERGWDAGGASLSQRESKRWN